MGNRWGDGEGCDGMVWHVLGLGHGRKCHMASGVIKIMDVMENHQFFFGVEGSWFVRMGGGKTGIIDHV
jgi:hypothetical protein